MDFTLGEIATLVNGQLLGEPSVRVRGLNSLEQASAEDISFFFDPRYKHLVKATQAKALLVREKSVHFKGPQIVVKDPELAYAKLAHLFAPAVPRYPGISERSFIHDSATIGKGVSIYPFVYVGEGADIGEEVVLFSGVYIGKGVKVGPKTIIYPNVTILDNCLIGAQVIIHAGTVIGSDGFGFVQDEGVSIKIPQMGCVQIDDQVEIGANCCVDRATFGRTWIQKGVKIDNLVQIAHNVIVGENTIIVAQAGISGSVTIGNQVIIGGQVGISDHLSIGDGAMIGSQSGVAKSIPPGEIVSGTPTIPHRRWLKSMSMVGKLPELYERIRQLEKKTALLEERMDKEE